MRALITGGAGFIGSNLTEKLSKNDGRSTGKVENVEGIRVKTDE